MSEVLEEKVKQLPSEARREVSDYVDFLLYKYQVRQTVRPHAGCMKGTFTWMSDDFNAPLEDFNEYQ
jgi:hypothetical protein